jgi:hypothetical protein
MSRDVTNADLFGYLKNALAELLAHARGGTVCSPGCLWTTEPTSHTFDCSAYRDAVDLLEVVQRKDVIVLDTALFDTVAAPIAGATTVKVPGGDVGISLGSRHVVLAMNKKSLPVWSPEDAIATGTALIAVGREAARLPDPEEVGKLAGIMADFGGTNLVELARHLLASGYQRVGGE